MLQNRVDPFGRIFKTPARGLFMGNRGLLHDKGKSILRPFKLKAWITCKLEFKGWHRPVMAPGKYTELFFLDEATSFAAGHRPCFECRRPDALRFKEAWLSGNPEYGFQAKTSMRLIDDIIHAERFGALQEKITFESGPDSLPDGTFIVIEDEPYLVKEGMLYLWSPFGYGPAIPFPETLKVEVLTPASVVHAFNAGYVPQIAAGQNLYII